MAHMDEAADYEPDEDDILVHSFEGPPVYFSVNHAYGVGRPHHFVAIDVLPDGESWWLEPEHAEQLGRKLVEHAADCRRRNLEQDRRVAEAKPDAADASE